MELNTIQQQTNWQKASSDLNANFSKVNIEVEKLKNQAVKVKGYFDSAALLESSHPNPRVGDVGYVKNTASSTGYYIHDVLADGTWNATTQAAPLPEAPLGEYYTKAEVDQINIGKINVADLNAEDYAAVGSVIFNAEVDGYRRKYNNENIGLKIKKNGTYEDAWQEYIPLSPIKVNLGQALKLTGYFSQPWAVVGLDKNFEFVKTFAFHDSLPAQDVSILIDDNRVQYILTSCFIAGINNFKVVSTNITSKVIIDEYFVHPFEFIDGKYIDGNGIIEAQENLSIASFVPEKGAAYNIYLRQSSAFIAGYGENGLAIEFYGRQTTADTNIYKSVTVNPSDSVKVVKVSYDRDFQWLLKIEKKSGGIMENQPFQKFPSLQAMIESNYRGLSVVGSQVFNKVANDRYIGEFTLKNQKKSIIPLNSIQKKQSLPVLISDDFDFPFANAYGSGTTNEGYLKGSLKDGTLIGYHYGVPQISTDDGNTWMVLQNADNSKVDFLGRIDNVFICDNSDLIIEHVIDGEAGSGVKHYVKRLKYVGGSDPAKWWVNDGLKLIIKGLNASATANQVYINPNWGFDSYKNIVLLSEYGVQGAGGATHVYLSTDFGATFTTILDLSDNAQISDINTRLNHAMVQKPYGDTSGLHIHGVSFDYFQDRIYACIGDGGMTGSHILWSDDMGETWRGNLYVQKFSMLPAHNETCIMQALKVIPFENHLIILSDATAQGFFYMERTQKDKIPSVSWLYDITRYGESKFRDEGHGLSWKPYMIGNNSRFSESTPMIFSLNIHSSEDQMNGLRLRIVATWDGFNFWNLWEVPQTQINPQTHFWSQVFATKNFIYFWNEKRSGKNKYVKLSQIN